MLPPRSRLVWVLVPIRAVCPFPCARTTGGAGAGADAGHLADPAEPLARAAARSVAQQIAGRPRDPQVIAMLAALGPKVVAAGWQRAMAAAAPPDAPAGPPGPDPRDAAFA